MGYPIKTTYPTVTVAQAASVSAAIDLETGTAVGFAVPATVEATTAQLSFQAATTLAGTYKTVKRGGTKLTVPVLVNDFAFLANVGDLLGIRYLKVVLETAGGVAVAQASQAVVIEVIKTQIV